MYKKIKNSFLLTCSIVAVVSVMFSAIPLLWFEYTDNALFSQTLQRQRQTGYLSPEGEDLYIVRILHARSEMLANGGAANGYSKSQKELSEIQQEVVSLFTSFAKNSILPLKICEELTSVAEKEANFSNFYIDSAGFEEILFYDTSEQSAVVSFGLEIEPATGAAVSVWINFRDFAGSSYKKHPYSMENSLDSYKAWLGLEVLDDWNAEISDINNVTMVSKNAHLRLQLKWSISTLVMCVATV